MSPRLLASNMLHAATWRNGYEMLNWACPQLLPSVPFKWGTVSWLAEDEPVSRRAGGRYAVQARFLVASGPVRFCKELEQKAYEHNAMRESTTRHHA